MYALSKDYGKLFNLLCNGHVAVGWANYGESVRDVVKIERRAAYDIYIGVRGVCYADVGSFDQDKGDELNVFTACCKSVGLEWIEPSDAAAYRPKPIQKLADLGVLLGIHDAATLADVGIFLGEQQ